MQTLQELYTDQLRDIYDAENQLVNALPKFAQAATSPKLRQAFNRHLDQTRNHVTRLERIFDMMNISPRGKTCEAMKGLVREGNEAINERGDASVKDAALIAAAQRVEHYEIAAYGTVCAYAEELSDDQAHSLLSETLKEEKRTDAKLTELAVNSINPDPDSRVRTARTSDAVLANESVVALYDNFASARAAIEALDNAGFARRNLSLIANDRDESYSRYVRDMDVDRGRTRDTVDDPDADEGAGFGAVIGTLGGLGVALIPGLGGFVVAGAAGAALFAGLGAATGAAIGGLTAGLTELGVDEERAEAYTQRLREGGALVIAHVDDEWHARAESVMRDHNPVDLQRVDRT